MSFDELGYRRYEWKCNNANEPSKRAAERFGFTFEGIFRQHMVQKGKNRDTAWYSVIDSEWPALKAAYQAWLSSDNFDADGKQIKRLEDFGGLIVSTHCGGDWLIQVRGFVEVRRGIIPSLVISGTWLTLSC